MVQALGDSEGDEVDQGIKCDTFGFPFAPYPLQRNLMASVYDTLERSGIGIFESPTGTGKTLSLLCPTLAWLRRRERMLLAERLAPCDGDDRVSEDWVREHRQAAARALADHRWHRRRAQRGTRRLRYQKALSLTADGTTHKVKARRIATPGLPERIDDGDFSLEAPPSLPMLEEPPDVNQQAMEEAFDGKLQLIFCSRTHSQLAQVLREIRRIGKEHVPDELAVVTLGARTNLCINDSIRGRARGGSHMNDLCRIATERGRAVGGCTLKKAAQTMADACLTSLLDMEEMVQRGRVSVGGGCPYYGSRQAAREADVLLVPYASLVNAETRRKLGIRVEANILIFDEAHNLLDAISEANSVTLTGAQARAAVDDLEAYASRYESRLSAGNSLRLRQLRQLCVVLHRHLAALDRSSAHSVGAFLVAIGADHFDLAELSRFLETTELPRKVRGFVEATRICSVLRPGTSNSVYGVAALLVALLGSTTDDRMLCEVPTVEGETASVRYLSLDAEARFGNLVTSARAVIFAGGTLEPRAEFAPLYVNPRVNENEQRGCASNSAGGGGPTHCQQRLVRHFAGQHIVPESHVLARCVTCGPSGHQLDFRKDARCSTQQLSDLRSMITATAAATPGGVVFFFPSFEYLGTFATSIGSHIGGRNLFVEARGVGGNTLEAFSTSVHCHGGAVLLAVSGGKLSEGIDFKDELCRLVAVVGLPYPNASDIALLEKMRFLDTRRAQGIPGLSGRELYSARCMKAVNQCIGRSIRHAGDWAAVLLLDHRYPKANVHGAISGWLRKRAIEATFKDTEQALCTFFSSHASAPAAAAKPQGSTTTSHPTDTHDTSVI